MSKNKENNLGWIGNLITLMGKRGFNPRSLSLGAGLNATAVRDMIEGRTRFPRYDTVQALARTLGTTPEQLMHDASLATQANENTEKDQDDDLALLTDIITRLQESVTHHRKSMSPQDFAAMVTNIYRQVKISGVANNSSKDLDSEVSGLIDDETARCLPRS